MKLEQLQEARYTQGEYVDWVNNTINEFIGMMDDPKIQRKPSRKKTDVPSDDEEKAEKELRRALGNPEIVSNEDQMRIVRWMIVIGKRTFAVDLILDGKPERWHRMPGSVLRVTRASI